MWLYLATYIILPYIILADPLDEFRKLQYEGDISIDDTPSFVLSRILPSGVIPHKLHLHENTDSDIILENLPHIKEFKSLLSKGDASRSKIFNIFDDSMRETTIALYNYLRGLKNEFHQTLQWAAKNINIDMFNYIQALLIIHDGKLGTKYLRKAYITKPNYFVNSETIFKSLQLSLNEDNIANIKDILGGDIEISGDDIYISSNYSNRNTYSICDDNLNYFREDIDLNNYYYYLHLKYPIWMTNRELDEVDSHHAEKYFFAHRQLLARYKLEHHFNIREEVKEQNCPDYYNPQLVYDNGLPFPIRPKENNATMTDALYALDVALDECINRGIVFADKKVINITKLNDKNIIAKFLRTNFYERFKIIKEAIQFFGYGKSMSQSREYSSTPSVLHSHMTSLRDPLYWKLMKWVLQYYVRYERMMQPVDMSHYETDEIVITDAVLPDVFTRFKKMSFNIHNAKIIENPQKYRYNIHATQDRPTHDSFTFKFKITSKSKQAVNISLFLGPSCEYSECLKSYDSFFQLSEWASELNVGENLIEWSSFTNKLLSDYDIPKTLLIPRGSESGLNLKLFIIVTAESDYSGRKPLGFPFHMPIIGFNAEATNYRFYDIRVVHKATNANFGLYSVIE